MKPERQDFRNVAPRACARRPGGFALVEVVLALVIVVLGAILFLNLSGGSRRRHDCERLFQDLRVFSTAFEGYHQRHNSWPPSTGAEGTLPPELAEALQGTNWFKGSPFGGSYGWVAPDPTGAAENDPRHGWGGHGVIILTAFSPSFPLTLDQSDLLYIEHQFDDSDLATGRFRTGFNGWPIYLVDVAKR